MSRIEDATKDLRREIRERATMNDDGTAIRLSNRTSRALGHHDHSDANTIERMADLRAAVQAYADATNQTVEIYASRRSLQDWLVDTITPARPDDPWGLEAQA